MTQQPDPGRSWRLGLVLALTLFTAGLGVLFRNPQLTALAEALALLLALSWLSARLALAGLRVARRAPAQASEDEWIPIQLEVAQAAPLVGQRVELADRFAADPLFQRAELIATLAPGQRRELLFERPCARGRGVFALGPVELAISDPLGLFRLVRQEPLPGEVVVYPRPLPLRALGLVAALEQSLSGEGSRPRPGPGTQLLGLRELRPGERAQRIHWRASARLSRLVVPEHEAPSRSEATLFLDLSRQSLRGVGRGSNVETAIRLGAAVVHYALDRGHSCGLVCDDGEPRVIAPRRGRRQRVALLDALARLQPRGEVPLLDLLERGGPLAPRGGCAVIVLNRVLLDGERFAAVWAAWQRRGVRCLAFVVDDTRLLQHDWASGAERGEPAPALLARLGIPCLEVASAAGPDDANPEQARADEPRSTEARA
ncbi:MAG: DUF58 domain-containing protein [Planctomycetota bacterium]